MLCEKCKIKKAVVFYTELDRTHHSLCNVCATEIKANVRDYIGIADADGKKYSPTSYLYELCCGENSMYYCKDDLDNSLLCGECKISISDILVRGYLNCPMCYDSFKECDQTNCYGDFEYQTASAQMPRRYSQKLLREQKIHTLRTNLRVAVESENFELAAQLRDEIKRMDI